MTDTTNSKLQMARSIGQMNAHAQSISQAADMLRKTNGLPVAPNSISASTATFYNPCDPIYNINISEKSPNYFSVLIDARNEESERLKECWEPFFETVDAFRDAEGRVEDSPLASRQIE
jgi:hypothetical protein